MKEEKKKPRRIDTNPSVVSALFCRPHVYDEFVKQVDGKYGMCVRELRIVDIGIPLGDDYDKAINLLKSFSMPMMKRFIEMDFPMKAMIMKQIEKKANLKPFDFSQWNWKHDNRHQLLLSGFTPLFVDMKYNSDEFETEQEMENHKNLLTFTSKGYEPKITGVYDE